MKDLWSLANGDMDYGIYLRFSKGVDKELRSVILSFTRWLRFFYKFPVKVVVYVKSAPYIVNKETREKVCASIFLPYDKKQNPYVNLATGDYDDLIKENGLYSATCSILSSLAHEITHYFQWINDADLNEQQANRKAINAVYKYLDYCDDK